MRGRRLPVWILGALLVILAVWAAWGVTNEILQKRDETAIQAIRLTGGDPDRGEAAIVRYGCGACHQIPGIPGARGRVGPPLTGVASRGYIAGKFANTPSNLTGWIEHPQIMDPGVDMPEMGIRRSEARDIAAYLYTLK